MSLLKLISIEGDAHCASILQLVRQEEELAVFTELRASKGIGRKVDYEVC